jgi:hypothetical protein
MNMSLKPRTIDDGPAADGKQAIEDLKELADDRKRNRAQSGRLSRLARSGKLHELKAEPEMRPEMILAPYALAGSTVVVPGGPEVNPPQLCLHSAFCLR